ncbi:MAG: CvpA family protein [Gammaproteobacteria bacterium]|nr:CvpA family protein [Gammaproteobacteria bacterium]MCH9744193.1 CvpA family protein [Gammaproteobacteria bacterium]
MNWFDFVIIGIIFISIVVSFFRGILREILSLIIWVAAFILAFRYAEQVGLHLQGFVHSSTVGYALAFLLIFLVVFFVGMVLNFFIKNVIDKIGFGPADRALGVCFGVARGVLVVAVLLMFIAISPMQRDAWYADSKVRPYFNGLVVRLGHFVPEQIQHFSSWIGYPHKSNNTQQTRGINNVRNYRNTVKQTR